MSAQISQLNFLIMRERWQQCIDLTHFFDYCADHFSANQPFSSFGNYVFNPGRPLALCTLYTPEIVSYAVEAEKSLLSYCLRHDYTAYIYRNGIYRGIHPTWHKARVLLNHLEKHLGIVWVDADTLILKQDRNVFEPFLSSPKPLHICKDFAKGISSYNAGVFFFQNATWSRQVLEDTDRFALENRPGNLWDHGSDQKVMCDIILQRDPQGEFHEAHEMSEFNTDPRMMDENTFLLHFMAYPAGFKIPWMNYWNANNLAFREEVYVDKIDNLYINFF